MIALEAIQLSRLANDILRQLRVDDSVRVLEVHEIADGTFMVVVEDRSPDTRFPGFSLPVEPGWSRERAARELRLALRDKLPICPLCQGRASMRRIVDAEAWRVECGACGRFEIESSLLDYFRIGYEDDDERILIALQQLATVVRGAARMPILSAETWPAMAKNAE